MIPCSHCGNELPDGATFCNQCWQTVDASAAPATPESGFTMPTPPLGSSAGGDAPATTPAAVDPPAPPYDAPTYSPPPIPEAPTSFDAPSYPGAPTAPTGSPWDSAPMATPPVDQNAGWGAPPAPAAPPTPGWPAPPPPPGGGYGAPGYGPGGYAPPPYGMPGYYGAPAAKTNAMAIASLICSICGTFTCITAPIGIVLGHIALSQIKKDGSQGRGLAIAGLVIGYLLTIGVIALIVLVAVAGNSDTTY